MMSSRLCRTLPALAALSIGLAGGALRADGRMSEAPRAVPGEVLVQFDHRVEPTRRRVCLFQAGLGTVRHGYGDAFEVVAVPPGRAGEWALAQLRRTPGVLVAEPNYYVHACAVPNDPLFRTYQWNLSDSGYGIHAETAWEFSSGSGVTVAVIDTGVAYERYGGRNAAPDLAGTRFVAGYDFIDNDTHPQDENGHGTHVAGTIAQSTNNGYGCAGIAYGASIMPVRVLGKDGAGTLDKVANGIRWAVDHGAQVINLSLGGPADCALLAQAVRYAASKDVVVVAAAGNNGSSTLGYPANYPEVIAVGATRYDGQLASYSNYGPEVDVVAPGGDMRVDQNRDGSPDGIMQQTLVPGSVTAFQFRLIQGTSMAAPHVAGVAALVRSLHPDWSALQVRAAIENTCRDLGAPGKDGVYGCGLVDAAAAVQYAPDAPDTADPVALAPPPDTIAPTMPSGLRVAGETWDTVTLAWGGSSDDVAVAGYRIYRDGRFVATAAGKTYTDRGRSARTRYRYTIIAVDTSGNASRASNQITATTTAAPRPPKTRR